MKFSLALAAALFLPVLVNAQYGNPTSSDTDTYPSSTGAAPAATSSSSAVPASNSTHINVSGVLCLFLSPLTLLLGSSWRRRVGV